MVLENHPTGMSYLYIIIPHLKIYGITLTGTFSHISNIALTHTVVSASQGYHGKLIDIERCGWLGEKD